MLPRSGGERLVCRIAGQLSYCGTRHEEVPLPTGRARVYASCPHEHLASQRVLEKCSFLREPTPPSYAEFPNLGTSEPQRIVCYVKVF